MLSDVKVRKLKPGAAPYKASDREGLYPLPSSQRRPLVALRLPLRGQAENDQPRRLPRRHSGWGEGQTRRRSQAARGRA